jgi:hypothetical protein
MGIGFWTGRFLRVMAGTFAILTLVQWLKGHGIANAAVHGITWALISAAVFTTGRYVQARRGQRCELCNDIPEAGPTQPRE